MIGIDAVSSPLRSLPLRSLRPRPSARRFRVARVACLALVVSIAGCAGSSNRERFFGLTDGAVVMAPAGADSTAAGGRRRDALPGIVVSAVTIPELVDRPQIVTRDSTDRVIVSEENLWAESIRSGIARTLATRVGRAMAEAGSPVQVGAYPQNSIADPVLRITVDVVRFDAVPNGEAVIDVLWSIRRPVDHLIVTGRSVAASPIAGSGYDAIVHGWNDALATVDADIAGHVRDVGLQPPPPSPVAAPAASSGEPAAAAPPARRRVHAKPTGTDVTR